MLAGSRRALTLLAWVPLVVLGGTSAQADPNRPAAAREESSGAFAYTVVEGDTLSAIAVRFGVSVEAILSQNPGLSADRIRAGQTLRIAEGLRRVVHTVARGESLSLIAAHYEVALDDLLRWNRGLRRDHLRAGRDLVVYTRLPESRSQSVGSPNRGQLVEGRQLPTRHPALFVRTPSRAWATDETVRWIVDAFDEVRRVDPEAPRVEVHDLSFRRGGPINGHRSHESGRDADLAYYQRGCRGVCAFRRIRPEQLDVARQWALFSYWLERGLVEAIFMDHELSRALYEHARAEGVSRRDLGRWFQYPRAPDNRQGVIRHHPRHADHFHVRFVCHESDPDCR
jgi:LysM repeat protein